MKTTKLLFIGILGLTAFFGNAQSTTSNATNTVSATDYLGSGPASDNDVVFKRHGVNAGQISNTNTSFGVNTGTISEAYAQANTYFGAKAGGVSDPNNIYPTGSSTYFGSQSGYSDQGFGGVGNSNSFLGFQSGYNSWGDENLFLGYATGSSSNGYANIALGTSTGAGSTASFNILIGNNVGVRLAGDKNVIIGYEAQDLVANNKLMIDNDNSITNTNPLIWGDFAENQIKLNGKVGIGYGIGDYPTSAGGVDVSGYNLFVMGGILVDEARIAPSANNTWADYVFHKNYNLKPLAQLEQFISDNGHLPNVPSACQVQEEGIALGEMAKIQQEKIEELTLYIIEQNKTNEAQNKLIMQLSERLNAIEKR